MCLSASCGFELSTPYQVLRSRFFADSVDRADWVELAKTAIALGRAIERHFAIVQTLLGTKNSGSMIISDLRKTYASTYASTCRLTCCYHQVMKALASQASSDLTHKVLMTGVVLHC